ncbi:MAG: site-2 protease family protein [Eubacterium sp.]|nr:site-2 protease family protein [Eubacterium sp.]
MFDFSSSALLSLVLSLPGIILAITFHEIAHGYAADAMGDPTPKLAGRLSVNPLKHLDPLGFICMLLFHFGWAKPVPVNPANFKNHRKGIVVVSLAGCLTNLLLGFIALTVEYAVFPLIQDNIILLIILEQIYAYNIIFAIFNLIPIPPLDGSQILGEFLPPKARFKYQSLARYGMILLMILLVTGLFGRVITPVFSAVDGLFRTILRFIFGFIY